MMVMFSYLSLVSGSTSLMSSMTEIHSSIKNPTAGASRVGLAPLSDTQTVPGSNGAGKGGEGGGTSDKDGASTSSGDRIFLDFNGFRGVIMGFGILVVAKMMDSSFV